MRRNFKKRMLSVSGMMVNGKNTVLKSISVMQSTSAEAFT